MILCCGEALIDMIPGNTDDNQKSYIPKVGGAVYNTAIALGRMECKPFFLGSISKDVFGEMIQNDLKKSNVNTSLCTISDYNSTFAFATIKNGTTTYLFIDENSANRNIKLKNLEPIKEEITSLYIGGILLTSEPCGQEIEDFISKESHNKAVFFDPNIRPELIKNREKYMARFEKILSQSDIIKISEEDFEWLYPNKSIDEVSKEWLENNLSIVVLTKGSEGAFVKTNNFDVSSKGEKVDVLDTIGAGDIFNAAFLCSLQNSNVLNKNILTSIEPQTLKNALKFANKVAGISVQRVGANSPSLEEINSYTS